MSEHSSNSIFSLVYGSCANRFIGDKELRKLVDLGQSKNQQLGITGYLYHKKRHFFQYLEGEQNTVMDLMEVIVADKRHDVLRTIHLGHRPQRVFSDWSLRFAKENEVIGLDGVVDLILCSQDNSYDDDTLRPLLINLGERIAKYLKGTQRVGSPASPVVDLDPETANASQPAGPTLSPLN